MMRSRTAFDICETSGFMRLKRLLAGLFHRTVVLKAFRFPRPGCPARGRASAAFVLGHLWSRYLGPHECRSNPDAGKVSELNAGQRHRVGSNVLVRGSRPDPSK